MTNCYIYYALYCKTEYDYSNKKKVASNTKEALFHKIRMHITKVTFPMLFSHCIKGSLYIAIFIIAIVIFSFTIFVTK